MKILVATAVILFGIYVGAVIGVRAAVSLLPKLSPVADVWTEQNEIDFSDGAAITPNFQLQPSVDVRGLR